MELQEIKVVLMGIGSCLILLWFMVVTVNYTLKKDLLPPNLTGFILAVGLIGGIWLGVHTGYHYFKY